MCVRAHLKKYSTDFRTVSLQDGPNLGEGYNIYYTLEQLIEGVKRGKRVFRYDYRRTGTAIHMDMIFDQ